MPGSIDPAAADLLASDPSATALGIELVDAGPDGATVRMSVRHDMCNGYGIVHGGMVFTLADSAMAFASVSTGGSALATAATIDWVAPAAAGDTLTASVTRRWSGGRNSMWDGTVTGAGGAVVALFRGQTRLVRGQANSEPR